MSDERSPTAKNSGSCHCRLAWRQHQTLTSLRNFYRVGFWDCYRNHSAFFLILILFVLTLLYKGTGTRNGHSLLTAQPTCMLRSIPPRAELPTTTLIRPELRSTDRTAAARGHSRGPCFTAKRTGLESVKRKSHLQLLLEHSPCWFGHRSSRWRWLLCRSKEWRRSALSSPQGFPVRRSHRSWGREGELPSGWGHVSPPSSICQGRLRWEVVATVLHTQGDTWASVGYFSCDMRTSFLTRGQALF